MRLVFMGTPQSAVPALRRCLQAGHEIAAVWTQPDRRAGRGKALSIPAVKEFSLAHGLEVHQPQKLRTAETLALFASYKSDAAVVVSYGRILPKHLLEAPRLGCINLHFSLLPSYRGAAPVNWAIVNGESETGVTTMLMDEGLDTGSILLQRSTPVSGDETAPDLTARLAELGASLLVETLSTFQHITPRPQVNNNATVAPLLKREDGHIEWSLSAIDIDRRVRGFQPWPGAYTEIAGKRLIIWRSKHLETAQTPDEPGTILEARGDDFVVACSAGSGLKIVELQLEGRRRTNVRDFLNGNQLKPGLRLV